MSAAAPVLELDALLEPMPGENPAGENLIYFGLHDEIREARRADDNLAQGDWKRELKLADWPQVVRLSTQALAARTKDLQVCAWLAEGLVKLHGFTGLRDGLRLMRGLHENFWAYVYPENDEGDLEARANAVAFMDRQVALALREVPLTRSLTGVAYSFDQWEDSKKFDIPADLEGVDFNERERLTALRQQAEEEGKITSGDWLKAKSTTTRAFYEDLNTLVSECWDEYLALDRAMDELYGRQTPGLGDIKKALDGIRDLVANLVKEKRLAEPDPITPSEGGLPGEEGEAGPGGYYAGGAGLSGPVRSRQEALRRLAEVAEFFRQTEPHSPVSYLVQRAIKWGEMPLENWLQEVIKDEAVLGALRETLGIKPPSEEWS